MPLSKPKTKIDFAWDSSRKPSVIDFDFVLLSPISFHLLLHGKDFFKKKKQDKDYRNKLQQGSTSSSPSPIQSSFSNQSEKTNTIDKHNRCVCVCVWTVTRERDKSKQINNRKFEELSFLLEKKYQFKVNKEKVDEANTSSLSLSLFSLWMIYNHNKLAIYEWMIEFIQVKGEMMIIAFWIRIGN